MIEKFLMEFGETILVGDPWFKSHKRNHDVELKVTPGEYQCKIKKINLKEWGVRVAEMSITNVKEKDSEITSKREVGEICTTGSTVAFSNLIAYRMMSGVEEDLYFGKISDLTVKKFGGVIGDTSFISCSGLGDGIYRIYEHFAKDKSVAYSVVFLELFE